MRKNKLGFTLIEVSLFLAITGLLFLGVTLGVQNSIYQQRYNDAVQSFANFLSNIYDEVLNVQSLTNGRHDKAIYGKLLTFGEEKDSNNDQVLYVYDVIGKTVNSGDLGSGTTLRLLQQLGADVLFRENRDEKYKAVGIIEVYKPSWGARVQVADPNEFKDYEGTILIVRDPRSGTVRTFVRDEVLKVNETIEYFSNAEPGETEESPHILRDLLTAENFQSSQVDFCINPNGEGESNRRTDIRLMESAMNSSGVEVLPLDSDENLCNK